MDIEDIEQAMINVTRQLIKEKAAEHEPKHTLRVGDEVAHSKARGYTSREIRIITKIDGEGILCETRYGSARVYAPEDLERIVRMPHNAPRKD